MMYTTYNKQRGVVSVIAMLFIVIFSSLAAAMAIVSQGNMRTTESYRKVNRALAAAETGLAFAHFRFSKIADTVLTTEGSVDQDLADILWPQIRDEVIDQLGFEAHNLESYTAVSTEHIRLGRTPVGADPGAPTFQVELMRHPIDGEDYEGTLYQADPYNVSGGSNGFTVDGEPVTNDNPLTSIWVRIRVEGVDGDYTRSIHMDYRIDKKVRYAILSRNRIMIGRNVMIEGSVGSRYTMTNYNNGHPVQIRNNFYGMTNDLDLNLDWLVGYLADYDQDGDNRVKLTYAAETDGDADIADYDSNGDGYVDSYDLFLTEFDTDEDGAISENEFTESGGDLYDEKLWQLINEIKYPAGTEFDWDTHRVQYSGQAGWVDVSDDLEQIDNDDKYTKIKGRIMLTVEKDNWEAGAANGPYQWFTQGPIAPDLNDPPMTFEASDNDMSNLGAADFNVDTFKAMATGSLADQVASPESNDGGAVIFTAASFDTREAVPFQSPHPYDYYERPVYENYVFEDIAIPQGSNALFVNCKFIGTTFVETTINNEDPNFNYAGMQNLNGSLTYLNATADVDGVNVADTKSIANNIRFHNCTFEGMVASDAPTTYAHVRNKIQFTGNTNFDLESNNLSASQKEIFRKSTIMAPQYSVDMGTFTNPGDTGENVQLDGAIIAGVFDIRGNATIDGSIITTYEPVLGEGVLAWGGSPASMNTTLGYFESTAGDSEGEVPDEGHGKIIIRYDPDRALPDGINGPIEFDAAYDTYHEGI